MFDLDAIFNDDRLLAVSMGTAFPSDTAKEPEPGIRPDDLPPDWREQWAELVAIREIHYGQAKEHAEAEALADVERMMRACGEFPYNAD